MAFMMVARVAMGWDSIGTWQDATWLMVDPARCAMNRWVFGGMAWSLGATRYQDGMVSQAGAPEGSPDAWTQLSPQELQIAELAAEGFSNRQIAQRLYLSHRTIGTHLYKHFPKLGVTSRTQLHDALQPRDH
jgi:DNA-binding NarL/FixJ family response regulator